MRFIEYPKELSDLMKVYKPYIEGCHLREDAPKEAKEAYEKAKKFCLELWQ